MSKCTLLILFLTFLCVPETVGVPDYCYAQSLDKHDDMVFQNRFEPCVEQPFDDGVKKLVSLITNLADVEVQAYSISNRILVIIQRESTDTVEQFEQAYNMSYSESNLWNRTIAENKAMLEHAKLDLQIKESQLSYVTNRYRTARTIYNSAKEIADTANGYLEDANNRYRAADRAYDDAQHHCLFYISKKDCPTWITWGCDLVMGKQWVLCKGLPGLKERYEATRRERNEKERQHNVAIRKRDEALARLRPAELDLTNVQTEHENLRMKVRELEEKIPNLEENSRRLQKIVELISEVSKRLLRWLNPTQDLFGGLISFTDNWFNLALIKEPLEKLKDEFRNPGITSHVGKLLSIDPETVQRAKQTLQRIMLKLNPDIQEISDEKFELVTETPSTVAPMRSMEEVPNQAAFVAYAKVNKHRLSFIFDEDSAQEQDY